ncbi:MAG: hypothetical protein JWN56_1216 [Sphingobacteriales bacterium]|nr:hypothetical protein [Sphingobacteriales bacterium]
MKNSHRKWASLTALAALILITASCSKNEVAQPTVTSDQLTQVKNDDSEIHYGPAVTIGNKEAKAWVSVNKTGDPIAIGVSLPGETIFDIGAEPKIYTLHLPKDIKVAPYDHIDFNWNPEGHPPMDIYTVPHYDLHFYMICEQDKAKIEGQLPPYIAPAPAAKYIPEAYVEGPGVEPQMGTHWADALSPEFNGKSFTRTMILGTYNAKVTFFEPMFTVDYLKTKPNEIIAIRQPEAFEKSGYYAKNYSFKYDENHKQYIIALTDLRHEKGK